MIKNKRKILSVISLITVVSLLFGALTLLHTRKALAENGSSYVEMYLPSNQEEVTTTDAVNFAVSVKDNLNTPSGKGLSLNYIATTSTVTVTLPIKITSNVNEFSGLAMWIDVPKTNDEYSFSLRIANSPNALQLLRANKELTLINSDGTIEEQVSVAQRLYLNGFSGWLMIPQSAFYDPIPIVGYEYQVMFLVEYSTDENVMRTNNLEITLGSFGYYTNYYSFILEKGGETSLVNKVKSQIDEYIVEVQTLKTKDNKELSRKTSILNELNKIKNNFSTLSTNQKIETAKGLSNKYVSLREKFIYGDVMNTKYVMSFAIMSDTHFSSTWINTEFIKALEDAKSINPDLAAAFVLGDLSDQGVSKTEPSYSDLDNYYDWLDSYSYKNSKNEDIPIINILGNHDVRGSNGASDGRTNASYEAAVVLYKEREGVDSIQFDKWINGYHFIFLNTDKYHKDDCYFSANTLTWLDETLSENEDGRPMFVMVHQPLVRIHEIDETSKTFEEIIASHPSAVVSSGHTHAAFGSASIVQNGEGTYINQPSMKKQEIQYYMVDVYEGGAVYKARECGTDSWLYDSYVVIRDEDKIPDTPEVPENPEKPDEPINPDIPNEPNNPEVPNDTNEKSGCNGYINSNLMILSISCLFSCIYYIKKKKFQ